MQLNKADWKLRGEHKIPVIFEIEPDTNEANGTAHPFCSPHCIGLAANVRKEIADRGFIARDGEDEAASFRNGSVCEGCGKTI